MAAEPSVVVGCWLVGWLVGLLLASSGWLLRFSEGVFIIGQDALDKGWSTIVGIDD